MKMQHHIQHYEKLSETAIVKWVLFGGLLGLIISFIGPENTADDTFCFFMIFGLIVGTLFGEARRNEHKTRQEELKGILEIHHALYTGVAWVSQPPIPVNQEIRKPRKEAQPITVEEATIIDHEDPETSRKEKDLHYLEELPDSETLPGFRNCPHCDNALMWSTRQSRWWCKACKDWKGPSYDVTVPVEFPKIISCPHCEVDIEVGMKGNFICPACQRIGRINEFGVVEKE